LKHCPILGLHNDFKFIAKIKFYGSIGYSKSAGTDLDCDGGIRWNKIKNYTGYGNRYPIDASVKRRRADVVPLK
jgi:hypothetical protein